MTSDPESTAPSAASPRRPRRAAVMIVKDEARCLARCLASVRPLVDHVIVLDTGSTDATVEIALAAGAQVERFSWCDDFSAARNAALACSDADWNLIIDADEAVTAAPVFEDPAFLAAEPFIGVVRIDSPVEVGGGPGIVRSWVSRLLPRGVRYAGRIHEQPVSDHPRVRVGLTLAHDGYLPSQLETKSGRNEALLLTAIKDSPDDAYLWYQLGRTYDAGGRYDAALITFGEALRLSGGDEAYRHGLVVRTLHAMKGAGALEQGLALLQAEERNWSQSADFCFVAGDLYLECASRDQANALTRWLPQAEASWLRCLEIGERDDLDGAMAGRGGYMAAHNLAALYETFGLCDQAVRYHALTQSLRLALSESLDRTTG